MAPAPDRDRLFLAACAGLFLFGVVLVLPGTVFGSPETLARLGLRNLVSQGDFQSTLIFGVFAATVIAGPLIDRFGNKLVLFTSALLVAVALAGFSLAEGLAAARLLAVLLGAGGGGLNTSTNALVSDLFMEERGPKLNLLAMMFSVGAVAVPMAASRFPGHMATVMLGGAALAALCTLAYALLPFPPATEGHSFTLSEALRVARYPGVLLLAVLLFFESSNEVSMGWIPTWARSLGASAANATLLFALFQGGMMLGRVVATRILRRVTKPQLVLASGVGAVLGATLILLAPSLVIFAVGVALAGLSLAAVYPTTLAIAGDRYPRFSGTVFGILFSVGLTGAMIAPMVIGHVSQRFGARVGVAVPVIGACMVGLLISVLTRRHPASDTQVVSDPTRAAADK